ncbi:MAG: hypothetical protein RL264_2026 [Bacteroidota bacterium]
MSRFQLVFSNALLVPCTYLLLLCCQLTVGFSNAQTSIFASLPAGVPTLNTTGWNLTGNAVVADTPGDSDTNLDEVLLTNNGTFESGGLFFQTPINPVSCSRWTVEYDYRIWGGNAADGLAFCFLDVPPTGFVSGGGVGIPGSANGLKVIFDTFDNCGTTNPELQIYYGQGYNECASGIVKIDNASGNLGFVRNSNYQHVKITYLNGQVTLFVNNVQQLTANFPITFSGFMGFTASTGTFYDQHSVKNIMIYTEQAPSDAGANISFCSGDSGSIGSLPNSMYSYSWSPAIGLSATNVSNPTVTLTNSGTTTLTQTYTVTTSLAASPGVCPTSDQVTVTVYPNFSTSISQTLCNGGPYLFAGQNLTTSGQYSHTFTSVYGCDSVVNLNLIISTAPVIPDLDTTICPDELVEFILGNEATYTWTGSILAVPVVGDLAVSTLSNVTLNLVATNMQGCSSSDLVTITVLPSPNINLVASDTVICNGESVVLTANGASSWTWQGFGVQNTNVTTQNVSPVSNQVYKVIGTNANGCSDSSFISIVVHPNPVLTISNEQQICQGETVSISVAGATTYQWTPQGSGTSSFLSPSQTTDFTVIGTDSNGCSDTVSSLITVHPVPNASFSLSNNVIDIESPTVTITNTSSPNCSYYWYFGDPTSGLREEMIIDYTYPPVEATYQITLNVTNSFGCNAIFSQPIQVKGDLLYYVPNTFTPDGDEFNSYFVPIFSGGVDRETFVMYIYNRWGEILFETYDIDKGWDGYYDTRKVQNGTYIYVIRYKIKNTDEYRILKGHVNVIR